MFDIEGKMNFLAGCALASSDEWTYLNQDARTAIKEAAAKLREQSQEIKRLSALLEAAEGWIKSYENRVSHS